MIKNYFDINRHLKINDFAIMDILKTDYSGIDDYQENYLLSEKLDAKGIVLSIAPIVFRIDINIFSFDPNNPDVICLKL